MVLRSKNWHWKLLISAVAFLVLTFSFQNCAGSFGIEELNSPSSLNSERSQDTTPQSNTSDNNNSYLKVKTFGSGSFGSCYLNLNSEVACEYGRKILKSLGQVEDFVTNVSYACGLNNAGKVTCTSLSSDTLVSTLTLENVKSLSSDIMRVCALTNDSKVFCYLGSSNQVFQEMSALQGSKKVDGGLCAISKTDQIQCAYYNSSTKTYEVEIVSTESYTDIKSAGIVGSRICALTTQGKVNCFDPNLNLPNTYVSVSMPQIFKPVKSFAFSFELSLGRNPYSICVVQIDDKILCWGSNSLFAINPLSDNIYFDTPFEITQQPVREIFKRTYQRLGTCLLLLDNTVKCSYNSKQSSAIPFLVSEFDNVIQYAPLNQGIALDAYRVKADGTVECQRTLRWDLDPLLPRDIDPCSSNVTKGFIPFGGLRGVKKIVSGLSENYWNCVLRSDGKVTCWGASSVTSLYSEYSALGNKQFSSLTPLGEVQGISNAVDLVRIYNGNCILNNLAEVWCWGQGPWNATASSAMGVSKTPIKLSEFNGFSQLVGWPGGLILVGIKNGEVYQVNYSASSGTTPKYSILKLAGGNTFKKLFKGGGTAGLCGLNSANQLLCWEGLSQGFFSREPKVMAQNVDTFYSSSTHGCAVTINRKLICFGSENFNGELALGDRIAHEVPAESPLFDNVQNVLLGESYTCVSEGGAMKCVGSRPYWSPSVSGDFLALGE